MKVLSAHIKNFKNIEDLHVNTNGGKSIYFLGRNGRGKTSAIQAIFCALTGNNIPIEPILDGEENAFVDVMIGDEKQRFNVTRRFTLSNKKGTLTIKNEEGASYSSPKKMLEGITGHIAFDPFAFAALPGKKKVEEFKKYVNIDTSELDAKHKEDYETRTMVNRDISQLQGQIMENDTVKAAIKDLPDFDKGQIAEVAKQIVENVGEGVNLAPIQEELNNATKFNSTYEKSVAYREQQVSAQNDHLFHIESCTGQIEELKRQIASLEEDIQDSKETVEEHKVAIKKADDWLKDKSPIDVEEIQDRLNQAIQTNNALGDSKVLSSAYQRLQQKEMQAKGLTDSINENRKQVEELIKASNLPEGFTFGEDDLLYNGLPYHPDQVETSLIVKNSIVIAKLFHNNNPEELLIVKFDASFLDSNGRAEAAKLLEEHDLQGFIEIVSDEHDDVTVVLEEELEAEMAKKSKK